MLNKFLIALCIVALALISPAVSADVCNATYNLSTNQIGSTYVSWNWDAGINLTDIFIDGVAQCGYDTEVNQIKFSGLYPQTTYTIRIVRDIGGESTCAVSTTGEKSGGGNGQSIYVSNVATPLPIAIPVLSVLLVIGIVLKTKKKD